jgi:hypothetical protein
MERVGMRGWFWVSAAVIVCAGCVTTGTVGSGPWAENQRALILQQYERGQITEQQYNERLREIVEEQDAYAAEVEAAKVRSRENRELREDLRSLRQWRRNAPDRYWRER